MNLHQKRIGEWFTWSELRANAYTAVPPYVQALPLRVSVGVGGVEHAERVGHLLLLNVY